MTKKYKNKYRIESSRLKNWDYRSNGAYFITICTHNREHFFGEIILDRNDKTMKLSEIGKLAEKYWLEITNHFSFVELGNFVVMPNHIHGILIINNESLQNNGSLIHHESLQCNDSTGNMDKKNQHYSDISPKSGSISTIIRSYKSIVSKHGHKINSEFNWQSKFYDIIIRNSISFERIQTYLENNPSNWKEDKFYNS